ncbi:GPW/gp25 family protein [Pseudomonas sp. MWU13-2105]|uniref:GPW/gp25 family protein n=1 Tax=Pseudomonas sp. MWU13-2105 TaxID=2935074 RepID=UPI00200DB42C|nr:GPW/gp25 family protein [Pseudomonas sp. MWU13-2105]
MSDSSFLGTGWSYPPVFDNANFELQLSSGVANINQSIDLLLKTPVGSRTLMPDYGCNLSSYVFRRIDASLQEEIIQSVSLTLLNGEPRIDVERVDLSIQDGGAVVNVAITYVVRQTNARHNHVFPFSQLEGTNLEIAG